MLMRVCKTIRAACSRGSASVKLLQRLARAAGISRCQLNTMVRCMQFTCVQARAMAYSSVVPGVQKITFAVLDLTIAKHSKLLEYVFSGHMHDRCEA
jgi:hypothetical protein